MIRVEQSVGGNVPKHTSADKERIAFNPDAVGDRFYDNRRSLQASPSATDLKTGHLSVNKDKRLNARDIGVAANRFPPALFRLQMPAQRHPCNLSITKKIKTIIIKRSGKGVAPHLFFSSGSKQQGNPQPAVY
jgi:hypothetical protein